MYTAKIEVRVCPRFKDEVKNIVKKTGLSLSLSIRLFLEYVVKNGELPFKLPKPSIRLTRQEEMELSPEEFAEYLKNLSRE